MYDFLVKLLGAGISAIIFFSPLKVAYQNETIIVATRLNNPVTEEIAQLVEQGFVFGLEYYISIIINDSISFNQKQIKQLAYQNGQWQVNDSVVTVAQIQQKLGELCASFPDVYLKPDDHLIIFVKATILPDDDFKKSVGMSTRVLWNHYVPKHKISVRFMEGKIELE
jgi:hypothetical protein